MIICQLSKTWFFCLDVFVLSVVCPSKKPPTKKGDKMRKQKQGSTRLKVVQTNTDLELKQKEDNQKDWENFNDSCKDFLNNEFKSLLEKSKMETHTKLYTFMFHLTQDFVWDKMPMGQFKRSIDIGVKDGTENYLDYIKDTYNIKPKENDNEKTKTLN